MFYYLFFACSMIQGFYGIYQLFFKKTSIMDIEKYKQGSLTIKEYLQFGVPIILSFLCLFKGVQYGTNSIPAPLHTGFVMSYLAISMLYQWANFLIFLEIKNGKINVENNDFSKETVEYLFGNKRILWITIVGALSSLFLAGGSVVLLFILIF